LNGGRRDLFAGQFLVSDAPSSHARECFEEALAVAVLAHTVETKGLFVQIAEQVKRFDADVSAFNSALEQRPEILDPIHMYATLCVFLRMVNHVVNVVAVYVLVANPCIGEHLATGLNVVANLFVQARRSHIAQHLGADAADLILAVALKQAHDRDFSRSAGSFDYGLATILVHEPREATYKSFVSLYLTFHFLEAASLHREPDAMVHEPRGFLRNVEIARDLVAADSILTVRDQPHRREPFVEADRRVFKDGSDLGAELLLGVAVLALPETAGLQERHFLAAACRADHAIRPANSNHQIERHVRIGEVADRVHEGLWSGFRHGS
jgi:hypothetical protein